MLIQFNIKEVKELKTLLQGSDVLIPTKEQAQNPLYYHQEDLIQPIDKMKLVPSFLFHKDSEVYLTVNTAQRQKVYADGFKEDEENQYLKMDMLNQDLRSGRDFTQTIDIRFLHLVLENNPNAEFFEVEIAKDYFIIMIE